MSLGKDGCYVRKKFVRGVREGQITHTLGQSLVVRPDGEYGSSARDTEGADQLFLIATWNRTTEDEQIKRAIPAVTEGILQAQRGRNLITLLLKQSTTSDEESVVIGYE